MPATIAHYYSVATGPGNSTAGSGATSLGGFISTTVIPDAAAGTLWDDVSGDESSAGDTEYRCEVRYNSGTVALTAPKAWISSETAGGASIAIGVDPTATSARASASAQAVTVANESTAPTGVTFSSPTTKAAGLAVSDIPAGNVKGIWWRRTVAAATAALNVDGCVVQVEGDSAA